MRRPQFRTMMPPGSNGTPDRRFNLAAVSSLPLVGQRAALPCRLCVAGRWRVRRSRAARNSRFWCLSYAGLLLPRSHCLRCSGRLADSCPRQEERSEEHTSELQSRVELVCRILLEKKKMDGTRYRNIRMIEINWQIPNSILRK